MAKQTMPPLLRRAGIESLAIFRALHLGDMLCAVPALRAALPAADITLVGLPRTGAPSHAARPDRLARFYEAARAARFDLALQMHGSGAVSNGIVQAFGARVTAGYAAGIDPAGLRGPQYFAPCPDAGAEPLRLLRLAEWLGAPPRGKHLER